MLNVLQEPAESLELLHNTYCADVILLGLYVFFHYAGILLALHGTQDEVGTMKHNWSAWC